MSKIVDWDILESLWQEESKIIAVWAFGSAQEGQLRTGSDIDIGVLVNEPLTLDEQLKLSGQIQQRLQIEAVDLIILNKANVILSFEAVSGRKLFSRDESKIATFVSLTARQYEYEMTRWRQALQQHEIVQI